MLDFLNPPETILIRLEIMLNRFIPFLSSVFRKSQPRLSKSQQAILKKESEKLELFKKIYLPLFKTNDENDGPRLIELLKSGECWENHFRPFEWTQQDYMYKMKVVNLLKGIETLIEDLPRDILRNTIGSFTHSICAIEGNKLQLAETLGILKSLRTNYKLESFLKNKEIPFPTPKSLSNKPENEVMKIRNYLLSTYLFSNLMKSHNENVINLSDHDLKDIHRVLLRDTSMEEFAGKFRNSEIVASEVHEIVYPYPQEVPALMKKFILFCENSITNYRLHPLMIASRILSTFLHIHPFICGNGYIGHLIMAYYLERMGYPPMFFRHNALDSLKTCLFMAQAGNDSTFLYDLTLQNMISILMKYQK